MPKYCLQSANIVIQQPLGSIVHLLLGCLAEQIGLLAIDELLPLCATEASVQSLPPSIGDVAIAGDQSINRHAEREIDNDLELAGPPQRFDGLPLQMRSVWVKKGDTSDHPPVQAWREILNEAVRVPDTNIDLPLRILGLQIAQELRAPCISVKEEVPVERLLQPKRSSRRSLDELLLGRYEVVVEEEHVFLVGPIPSISNLGSPGAGKSVDEDQFEPLFL